MGSNVRSRDCSKIWKNQTIWPCLVAATTVQCNFWIESSRSEKIWVKCQKDTKFSSNPTKYCTPWNRTDPIINKQPHKLTRIIITTRTSIIMDLHKIAKTNPQTMIIRLGVPFHLTPEKCTAKIIWWLPVQQKGLLNSTSSQTINTRGGEETFMQIRQMPLLLKKLSVKTLDNRSRTSCMENVLISLMTPPKPWTAAEVNKWAITRNMRLSNQLPILWETRQIRGMVTMSNNSTRGELLVRAQWLVDLKVDPIEVKPSQMPSNMKKELWKNLEEATQFPRMCFRLELRVWKMAVWRRLIRVVRKSLDKLDSAEVNLSRRPWPLSL